MKIFLVVNIKTSYIINLYIFKKIGDQIKDTNVRLKTKQIRHVKKLHKIGTHGPTWIGCSTVMSTLLVWK